MYISILFCSIIYVINVTIIEIDQKNLLISSFGKRLLADSRG